MDDVLDRVLVVQFSRGVYRYTASLGTLLLYPEGTICMYTVFKYVFITLITWCSVLFCLT